MKKFIFTPLFLFLTPCLLLGGYKMGTTRPVKVDPYESKAPREEKSSSLKRKPVKKFDESPFLKNLAQKYRIELGVLEYFRKLKYGYEELVPAIIVANEANLELGKILSQRDKGKTWQQIADNFSINLKPLNKKVVQELKPLKKALPKEIMEERPTYIKND